MMLRRIDTTRRARLLALPLLALGFMACGPRPLTRWDHSAFDAQTTPVALDGCVDLGFSLPMDEDSPTSTSILLQVSVRNRCVRPVPIDLRALAIRRGGGSGETCTIFDPRKELRAVRIDGDTTGTERFRLDCGEDEAFSGVCIDASRVVPRETGALTPPNVCFSGAAPTTSEP